jgi:hypothetical protein
MGNLIVEAEKTIYITGTMQEIDNTYSDICKMKGVSEKSRRKK